ncbi:MAG TPA: SDR family NAD(P)-dependent oxidoreductase [Acidimicrobiales bacterium]|nr:SDR family NAD(P)-dependent oxidoreductase [Acidimicrobiales bacterium]
MTGRVAIVTGAGRGLGRQHALLLAGEGAQVVVNDVGCGLDGSGRDPAVADEVVAEIVAAGGQAIANADDVADWDGGHHLVDTAIAAFGDLHVLVNNAGILRDRYLAYMTEAEWDEAVRANLKGHFVPTRAAAAYWRRKRTGHSHDDRAVINTTSTAGLFGNPGQANYSAAKAAIVGLTLVAAEELSRYGARCNAIAPLARTRLTESVAKLAERMAAPDDPSTFDRWDPANVSPLVAWLASSGCPATGRVFLVDGGAVRVLEPRSIEASIERDGRWTVPDLATELSSRLAIQ